MLIRFNLSSGYPLFKTDSQFTWKSIYSTCRATVWSQQVANGRHIPAARMSVHGPVVRDSRRKWSWSSLGHYIFLLSRSPPTLSSPFSFSPRIGFSFEIYHNICLKQSFLEFFVRLTKVVANFGYKSAFSPRKLSMEYEINTRKIKIALFLPSFPVYR